MDATQTITIVSKILLIAVLGGINSLFSYFLDYCFWEGSIFGKWLPFSAKMNLKFWRKKEYELLKKFESSKDFDNMLVDSAQNLPFFKISGGCIICMNVWLGLISFSALNSLFLHFNYLYLFPYCLFSSYILRRIMK